MQVEFIWPMSKEKKTKCHVQTKKMQLMKKEKWKNLIWKQKYCPNDA